MIYALPYLTTPMADEMLRATRRLQEITHECWTVDWEQFALICPHGVRIQHWSALHSPPHVLRRAIVGRHKAARIRVYDQHVT